MFYPGGPGCRRGSRGRGRRGPARRGEDPPDEGGPLKQA